MLIEKLFRFTRSNSKLLILCTLLILFNPLIENYINKLIVIPFLCKVNSGIINDVVFILIFLIIVIDFYIKKVKKYKVTTNTFFQCIIIIVIYFYYRFADNMWDFKEFYFIPIFKYFDIFAFYLIGNVSLFFLNKKKKLSSNQPMGFYLDKSLGKQSPDLLNRENLAKYICTEIAKTHIQDSSFAIGISSEWGSGKTSFFDLIERSINPDTNIIIKFNPWINHEPKSIIKDFFDALNSKLKEFNSDISPLIKNYVELLLGMENNNFLNPFIKHYSQKTTIHSEFEQIDSAINSLDKKIIILIDDLDRLYKEEIIQVVKLIRNSANFGNTVFIVAYERNYIVNAIKKINNSNPELFLEKIFQLEIRLPNFEYQIVKKRIFDMLYQRVNESDKTILLKILLGKKNLYDTNVFNSGVITTLRDATRFSNSFLVAYNFLQGEIVLSDLLNLEILRLKYPGVNKLLFYNSEEYLDTVSNAFDNTYYILRKLKDNNGEDIDKLIISQYLEDNSDRVGIPKSEIEKVLNILYLLFPSEDYIKNNREHDLLSISNPSSFERYSHYRLLDCNISEIEFSRYRTMPYNEFCKKIEEWVSKGLRWDLKSRFELIKSFSNKEDFEKVIKAIFYFARLPLIESVENDYSGFSFENLYNKLNKINIYLKLNYYSDKNEYITFLENIFKDAPSPFTFEIEFIYSYIENYLNNYNFVIPLEFFQEIRLKYLEKYITNAQNFDSNLWLLYNFNDLIEAVPQGNSSFKIHIKKNPIATSLIIDFIKSKALDDFLLTIIDRNIYNNETFSVSNIIPKMFENNNKFGDFLDSINEDDYKYLIEFKDFYSKLKEVDYIQYINYKFSVIPINNKNQSLNSIIYN